MCEVNTSKKLRPAADSNGCFFPINNLPDELITYILCFLPIQDAVKTSVLSRDWEHKWTFIPDLNIHDAYKFFSGKHKAAIFVSVVDRLLFATNRNNNNLRTFRLSCGNNNTKYHSAYLSTWLSEVLRRNVQTLVIQAPKVVGNLGVSSRCWEKCTALTELNLSVCNFTLALPNQRCLLNLKSLYLDGEFGIMTIKSHQSAYSTQGHVLLNFPVLEFLHLRFCRWLNVKTVEINAPKLITFKAACIPQSNDYSIKICGPKLVNFESTLNIMEDYTVYATAVTCATLCHETVTESLPLRAHKVLKGFPELTFLTLSGRVAQALTQAKLSLTLCSLKQLVLSSSYSTDDLMKFLKLVPFLESLSLTMGGNSYKYEYDFEHQQVANLPLCITSSIKEVKFLEFREDDGQVELTKFILKSAENLRSVLVSIKRGRFWTKGVKNRLASILKPKNTNCVLKVEFDSLIPT